MAAGEPRWLAQPLAGKLPEINSLKQSSDPQSPQHVLEGHSLTHCWQNKYWGHFAGNMYGASNKVKQSQFLFCFPKQVLCVALESWNLICRPSRVLKRRGPAACASQALGLKECPSIAQQTHSVLKRDCQINWKSITNPSDENKKFNNGVLVTGDILELIFLLSLGSKPES